MESIILRAMALRPEDRYPSVSELGQALLPFGSGRGRLLWEPVFGAPTPERLLEGPSPFPRRSFLQRGVPSRCLRRQRRRRCA